MTSSDDIQIFEGSFITQRYTFNDITWEIQTQTQILM